jgi:hypothetical protein
LKQCSIILFIFYFSNFVGSSNSYKFSNCYIDEFGLFWSANSFSIFSMIYLPFWNSPFSLSYIAEFIDSILLTRWICWSILLLIIRKLQALPIIWFGNQGIIKSKNLKITKLFLIYSQSCQNIQTFNSDY